MVTSGRLAAAHPHLRIIAEHVEMPRLSPAAADAGTDIVLPVALGSAYASVLGDEPLFTNFTGPPSNFVGTLDYIFYSAAQLRPTQARASTHDGAASTAASSTPPTEPGARAG